jgi:predicted ribosome quality control (RQC) complex YloA/Tae2 family protein
MHVDALTLAAIGDELRDELVGMRVEDVIQPTPHAVALALWGGGRTTWLLASAHPQMARLHTIERKPQKLTTEPPPFVMLLRKHLEGSRVLAVEQPRWERVLALRCARRTEGGETAPAVWLVVELMGRLSNLILRSDGGLILGALHQVSAQVNRYRTIAPNLPYVPPPPQTRTFGGEVVSRLDGEHIAADDLRAAAREQPAAGARSRRPVTVANLLASNLMGFSQELAREVAVRALGTADALPHLEMDWEALAKEARALARLMTTRAWQPTLVLARDSKPAGEPVAFAVYRPRQYGDAEPRPMPSANATLEAYYRRAEWRDAVEGAKAALRRVLTGNRDRCVRKAEVLEIELAGLSEADRLRAEGDTLLAFGATLEPGATQLTIDDPFAAATDGRAPKMTITLDPQLTAVENANRRFARYHKLRRAAAAIPPQQAANALELAHIDQLRTDLDLAETTTEIAQVREEVAEAGYLRSRNTREARKLERRGAKGKGGKAKHGKGGKPMPTGAPMRRQSSDGMTLLAGKNSRQNEDVTFHLATGNDLWLHARGLPGAHVIVKSAGGPVPDRTLREAAALAAYYSQARESGSVPVDYTEQRYVRHMKGGGPGMVIYERERTLQVAPADLANA